MMGRNAFPRTHFSHPNLDPSAETIIASLRKLRRSTLPR